MKMSEAHEKDKKIGKNDEEVEEEEYVLLELDDYLYSGISSGAAFVLTLFKLIHIFVCDS
jgi:general transcription factor 3C polypeptide 6